MINPELKVGDRIILLHMEDEYGPVPMGTEGTVKKIVKVFGETHYEIDWDNGSRLSLIPDVDKWDIVDNIKNRLKNKLKEDNGEFERNKKLLKNIDVFKFFNMRFLKEYLIAVRDSGIVNMFGASPYLYMGSERIEHQFKYQPIPNEDEFEKVLEMADQAQAEMINGVIKVLESKNIEPDLDQINRYLNRYSLMVLENYMLLF